MFKIYDLVVKFFITVIHYLLSKIINSSVTNDAYHPIDIIESVLVHSEKRLIELIDTYRRYNYFENEWLEFKIDNDNIELIGEYISALSNGAKLVSRPYGYLIYGINDKTHEVVGTKFNYKIKVGNEELENWLSLLTNPKIDLNFYEVEYSQFVKVVVIEIGAAIGHPTSFKGIEYVRVGSYKKKLKDHPNLERKLWMKLSQ